MTRVFEDLNRRTEKWLSYLIDTFDKLGTSRGAAILRKFKLQKCFALRTTLFAGTTTAFIVKRWDRTLILTLPSS